MSDRGFLLWLANHIVYSKYLPPNDPLIDHLALMAATMPDDLRTPSTSSVSDVINYPVNDPLQTDLDYLLVIIRFIRSREAKNHDFVLKLASIISRYINENQVQLTM